MMKLNPPSDGEKRKQCLGLGCAFLWAMTLGLAGPSGLQAQGGVSEPYVSPPFEPIIIEVDLRTLPRETSGGPSVTVPEGGAPRRGGPVPAKTAGFDPVIQAATPLGGQALSPPIVNVAGMNSSASPPDTVGDVGPNHYIQMVNATQFQIFDKNGNDLSGGALSFGSLWPSGDSCRSNIGDPIVVYDHLADRWLLSQFGQSGINDYMCIAISQGPDPTPPTGVSTWFLYTIEVPVFPDYPKFGVWPDAYYMSDYEGSFLGVFAFDREAMLAGQPATFVRFTIPSLFGSAPRATRILPGDLDGPPSPPGTPNPFFRTVDNIQDSSDPRDRIEIWEFSVNFQFPFLSSFTLEADLDIGDGLAPFDVMVCNLGTGSTRDCIPQPGTTRRVDALSNRPMMQLKYREFSDHAAMVVNQTIDVGASIPATTGEVAGLRWYELRRSGGGGWSIFQQGTYAPQPANPTQDQLLHRWMGSAAMDREGNIALGYSISNSDSSDPVFPGIRYTGRLAGDPPGILEAEQTILEGTESQTISERWGDYSAISVDPQDDCTFWYTTHVAGDSGGRPTRIASFRFPSCEPLASLGGSVTGLTPSFGLCLNLASSDAVVFALGGATSWDCAEEGLLYNPGDTVLMLVQGTATGGDPVGGSLIGATGRAGLCRNLSSEDQVVFPLAGATSWDCQDAGLAVSPGDTVRTLVLTE